MAKCLLKQKDYNKTQTYIHMPKMLYLWHKIFNLCMKYCNVQLQHVTYIYFNMFGWVVYAGAGRLDRVSCMISGPK